MSFLTGRGLSALILTLATLLGGIAFLYPFFAPQQQGSAGGFMAHAADAPVTFLILLLLCLVVIIANLETRQMDSKVVAVLGILVAINAALRLIPGPAGFTAMLFLPILSGYAYGADFGFLLGALSLLVSAIVTGGMGPWLPYQMFSAGWMGMASAWVPRLRRFGRAEVVLLALWGAMLGLVFGAIMNLWFWPFMALGLYAFVRAPAAMVVACGIAQCIMLPLLGAAALYFRYRRSDPNLRPGRLWDIMLWVAFAAFLIVGAWSVFTVFAG